jgi:hypothetical protein
MQAVKIRAVVYSAPFQYLHPLKSRPPSEITWDHVARIQANARLALSDLALPQIVEIADAVTRSMESFYNDCEFLRWMGHAVPTGESYYNLHAAGNVPSPNDSPFSDVEIVAGYCLKHMALKYTPAQIFAVFALMKLDEMAERHHYYRKNPKRTVDLEMSGSALCEAMEALSAAYSAFRIKQAQENEKSVKKRIAAHAASGRTQKYAPLKEMVLKKYAAGKYPSPHAASVKIWEDICQNLDKYPPCHLVKSRAQATIYGWMLSTASAKSTKTAFKRYD